MNRFGVVREIASGLLVLAVVVLWFVFLRPPGLGGDSHYVFIKGDSMEPTYHTGDLVIVRGRRSYEPGQVAAFQVRSPSGQTIVIHRIRSVEPDGTHILRGDNRPGDDPWHPTADEILGVPIAVIPRAGTVAGHIAANPLLLGLVCAAIAGIAAAAERTTGSDGRSGESESIDRHQAGDSDPDRVDSCPDLHSGTCCDDHAEWLPLVTSGNSSRHGTH